MARIPKTQIQRKVNRIFEHTFGRTPINQRVEDILKQAIAVNRFNDLPQLKEKLGDLLTSTIQACSELELDSSSLIAASLAKITRRKTQYQALGRKTRVAILGGAFDPITEGHVALAKFILATSGQFDEVWFMPCYQHMYGKKMATAAQRLEMCRLATAGTPNLKPFDYELKHAFKGETYHLVKHLKEEKALTDQYEFSLVMGVDNANTFDRWVNYELLEKSIPFVVVGRKGVQRDVKVTWYLQKPHLFLQPEDEIPEISSTQIRNALGVFWCKRGMPVILKERLNKKVLKYIIAHKLYS